MFSKSVNGKCQVRQSANIEQNPGGLMSPWIGNVTAIVVLVALAAGVFSNSMTKPVGHDEQMYCTGGVLLAQGKVVYRDFSYVGQMPYHPLLYAALYKALNTTHYLLTGRVVSAVCNVLVILCIVAVYRRIFKSFRIVGTFLGLASALWYVFNPFVDYANGFAWNHDVVMLCVMLSLWIFVGIDFQRESKYSRIALIGVLLTLASCMRITTVLIQLLFFVVLLSCPADSARERLKTVVPFLIATACLLIWPVWTIASAPRASLLNLILIPALNGQWQQQTGAVRNKLDMTLEVLRTPAYLMLILMAVYLYLMAACNRCKLEAAAVRNMVLSILLALTFFLIAFFPPTLLKQYLAMPVPFLTIALAYPLMCFCKGSADSPSLRVQFRLNCILVALCVLVAVASYPVVLERIPRLFETDKWVPNRLHRISRDISEKTKGRGPILTLAPLYALEGGCDIYVELAAGPFVYRVADSMSPDERRITNAVGPETLEQLLEDNPPSAVIISVEPGFLEKPLFQTAVKRDWEKRVYEDGPVVYFAP